MKGRSSMFQFRRRIYGNQSCLYLEIGGVARLVGASPVKSDGFGPCAEGYIPESVAPLAVDGFYAAPEWAGDDLDHGRDPDAGIGSDAVEAIEATPAGDDLNHGFLFKSSPRKELERSEGHFAFMGEREIIIDGSRVWEAPIDAPVDPTGWRMDAQPAGSIEDWARANGFDPARFARAHARVEAPVAFVNNRINAA